MQRAIGRPRLRVAGRAARVGPEYRAHAQIETRARRASRSISPAAPESETDPRVTAVKRSARPQVKSKYCSTSTIAISPSSRRCGDHAADLLDDVGLDALGRLVQQQDAGPRDQRAGDGELLLLAAREIAAASVAHVLQHRKQLQIWSGTPRSARAGRRSRSRDSPVTVMQGKDLAALWHVGDAGPRGSVALG